MTERVHTFVLGPGAGHHPKYLEPLSNQLQAAGHRTVLLDPPTDQPGLFFTDYGEQMADELKGIKKGILIAHSHFGNIAVRAAVALEKSGNTDSIEQIILVAGAFERSTAQAFGKSLEDQPPKNSKKWRQAVDPAPGFALGQHMTQFNPDRYPRLFCHDVEAGYLRTYAMPSLRPQHRPPWTQQEILLRRPAVRFASVICTIDRVVNPTWQRWAASYLLELDPAAVVELPSSHMPMLSRPEELAQIISQLAA